MNSIKAALRSRPLNPATDRAMGQAPASRAPALCSSRALALSGLSGQEHRPDRQKESYHVRLDAQVRVERPSKPRSRS
jgi:hypothetical protein